MFLLIAAENNSHFSVAVGGEKIEIIKTVDKAYRQSELLLKTIDQLLKSAELLRRRERLLRHSFLAMTNRKIRGIIVVSGPGQFSALRTGVATANALAYAGQIPVAGVQLETDWLQLKEKEKLEKVWLKGVKMLRGKKKFAKVVVPKYGGEPNINLKK